MRSTIRTANGAKRSIALDIDGVTFNTFEHVRRHVNQANGTSIGYHEIRSYPLSPSFPGSTPAQIAGAFHDLWVSESHKIDLLDPAIPSIINFLRKEGWEVNIVTCAANGSPLATENIKAKLEKHGIFYDNFHHLRTTAEKAKLNMKVHIEDDPHIMYHTEAHIIFYPQPWVRQHVEDKENKKASTPYNGRKILEHLHEDAVYSSNGHRHSSGKGLVLLARDWEHIKQLLMANVFRE